MKGRTIGACVAVLVLCTGLVGRATGPSDVADAVMTGDAATLRTLLQKKSDVNLSLIHI